MLHNTPLRENHLIQIITTNENRSVSSARKKKLKNRLIFTHPNVLTAVEVMLLHLVEMFETGLWPARAIGFPRAFICEIYNGESSSSPPCVATSSQARSLSHSSTCQTIISDDLTRLYPLILA